MSGGPDTHLNAGCDLDHSRREGGSEGGNEQPGAEWRTA